MYSFQDGLPAAMAASVIAFLALIYMMMMKRSNKNYPPIGGTIFHQLVNLHRLIDYHTEISRKYRTFRMLTPFCNYVYTVDPANVEYILKTNFPNYGKGKLSYDVLRDLFGDGIFAIDGPKWKHQRKLASFEFSTKVLRDYSSVVFKKTGVKLARIVAEAAESCEMIEIQDLFMRATLDSIFKIGFGVELDTLPGSNEEGKAFAKAFDITSAQLLRRYFDVFWKLKRLLNIGEEASMRKSLKLIDDFVYKVIEKKIEEKFLRGSDSMEKGDILSRFLLQREKDPEYMNYTYLRDIILNFVIAGRDTSAGTLAWFFYMLSKHSDVQEKVVKELMLVCTTNGEHTTIENFTSSLTEEALSRMQYLHAALTETLRLYPAVPLDYKICFSDDTLPDGFDIKKGDVVNYQAYPMGRMEFLWGDDAEEFKPERWLNNDGVFVPESPFKFTAFQAGPRICIGKDFAYLQMKIIAAILVRFFKFKLWDENKQVKHKAMLTLQIDGGLYLSALQR